MTREKGQKRGANEGNKGGGERRRVGEEQAER